MNLAKTSALPEKAQGLPESGPVCGANTPGSLARYDPDTSLWKTSQLCLDGALETFSETWPRSGMMRSGTAFRLPTLVHLTDGIGSGSSRIPTPRAYMGNVTTPAAIEKGVGKVRLEAFVKMWPTPTATDTRNRGSWMSPNVQRRVAIGKQISLSQSIYRWPTPTARDWKSGKASDATHDRNSRPMSEVAGGSLNPTWVEALMGFPHGWTNTSAGD